MMPASELNTAVLVVRTALGSIDAKLRLRMCWAGDIQQFYEKNIKPLSGRVSYFIIIYVNKKLA